MCLVYVYVCVVCTCMCVALVEEGEPLVSKCMAYQ